MNIFELTVLGDGRISAHKLKYEKYTHFQRDIQSYNTEVYLFEIGSHTGFIDGENRQHLKKVHTFFKTEIKQIATTCRLVRKLVAHANW